MQQTKYIIITGGVLSGLGKGIVSSSIGRLLDEKLKIVPVKCDGYLNVDPGTMNPIEHGEVFVLDDGGEVDLDFGHYERFLNINCKKDWSISSGKVFLRLLEKERNGDFLGKTVQIIPHVTGEIRNWWDEIAKREKADVILIEIGGTVGDMENQWFIEAARELERYKGRDNVVFVHLGLVPVLDDNGQQKTKPLQQSITQLRSCGIFPDFVVGRSTEKLTKAAKEKIEWLCNLTEGHVISDPSLKTVYALPIIFEAEGLAKSLPERLQLQPTKTLNVWKDLLAKIDKPSSKVKVAICGKYTELADSYISVSESLIHAGAHHDVGIEVVWIETTQFESDPKQVEIILSKVQGLIVPGGFGSRGTEGKIMAIKYAREHKLPYLGLCFGLQLAVIEFARHVCNMPNANSTEINPNTKFPVVDIMEHQKAVTQKGGSMRLGNYDAKLLGDSKVSQLYKQLTGDGAIAHERHRHRYEVNPAYHQQLVTGGIQFSGTSADGKLVEFIELKDHPFFMATQAHPELKSRLDHPAPLFYGFVQAIKELSKHKNINNSQ